MPPKRGLPEVKCLAIVTPCANELQVMQRWHSTGCMILSYRTSRSPFHRTYASKSGALLS